MKPLLALLAVLFRLTVLAAETIPPAPDRYFNDYAGVVSAATAGRLEQRLEQFERDSSCQILVVIYPRMRSDSAIEDYTVRVAQAWRVGQKEKKNGAVLFVFTQDRKLFLQTGYGLEGALPDAVCKRIIEDEIKPQFKAGNYDAGLTAGVEAILAAAKGEYQGSGRTVADRNAGAGHGRDNRNDAAGVPVIFIVLFVVVVLLIVRSNLRRGGYYSRSGWSGGGWWGGGWSGGGGWGGGGGGGGGFSGGGGSFGGGGAGGSW